VVAKAGVKAVGEVSSSASSEGQPMHVALKDVRLKVGAIELALRGTQKRAGDGALEYHRVEDSGRVAVTLYVSENVVVSGAQ